MEDKRFVSKKELWMYALGAGGQGMIYATMSSTISDYYLNVFGLTPLFVFLLMLGARVWDAINDPMMGMIVDRKSMKNGRMRPYILIATPIIGILTILMFLSPNFDPVVSHFAPDMGPDELRETVNIVKMVFAGVVYVLWGMAYTLADVPFWTLPNVLTPNSKERSDVVSFTKIINSIGSAIPEVLFIVVPIMVGWFISKDNNFEQYEKTRYLVLAIIVVIFGGLMYMNSYFHIKEKVILPDKKKVPGQPGSLSRIFKCKPLMLVIAMGILSSGRYLVSAASLHVARYSFYIGDDISTVKTEDVVDAIGSSINTVKLVINIAVAVGMFGITLFLPKLMRKIDYKKIVIVTCIMGFAASVLTTVIGYFTHLDNLWVLIPFILVQSIPLGVINVVSYAMICDCLDYMELTTGHRENGLGSACQGFINKIGNAFATCGVIIMYMVLDINPQAVYSKVSMDAAASTFNFEELRFPMFLLVSLIPGISMLLCAIPMFFYKIAGKEKENMIKELTRKRKKEGFKVEE